MKGIYCTRHRADHVRICPRCCEERIEEVFLACKLPGGSDAWDFARRVERILNGESEHYPVQMQNNYENCEGVETVIALAKESRRKAISGTGYGLIHAHEVLELLDRKGKP